MAGAAFTVTVIIPTALAHPPVEEVTEYVPPAAVAIVPIVGFCEVEVNPAGPVHAYVDPELLAVKLNVFPLQIGFGLAVTVGVEGAVVIVIVFVSEAEQLPIETVAVNAVVVVGFTVIAEVAPPWLHK